MRLRQLFENIHRTGEGKTAVVGWGRGMGHKGHMMLASSVITHAQDVGGDPYFVVSRNYGPDDPLQPEEKIEIYRKVFPEQGHIFQTTTDELPDLTKILTNLNQQGYTNAIVILGKDQVPNFQFVKNYNGKPDKKGNIPYTFDNLQVISRHETTDPSREEDGPRATPMRLVLTNPEKFRLAAEKEKDKQYDNMSTDQMQYAVWRKNMPDNLSDEEVMALMHKAKERMAQMSAEKKPNKKQGVAEDFDSENNPWHVTDVDAVSETDFEVALQGPGGIKLNFVIRPVDFVETQRERYQIDSMDVRDLQSGKTMHWGSMQNLGKWGPIFDAIDEYFWMDRSLQAHLAKIVDYYMDAGEHGKNPDMMPDLDKRDPNGIAVSAKDYIASHNQADTAIKSAKKK